MLQQLFCFKMSILCRNVFLVCVTPPTASLANRISTPRVASWQKTSIAAMEASKRTGSEIADSTQTKNPSKKLYEQRHIKHE